MNNERKKSKNKHLIDEVSSAARNRRCEIVTNQFEFLEFQVGLAVQRGTRRERLKHDIIVVCLVTSVVKVFTVVIAIGSRWIRGGRERERVKV